MFAIESGHQSSNHLIPFLIPGKPFVITVADILGPEGRIAARLPNYEFRSQQMEMANAVAQAISDKKHLVVEAGTGGG